MVARHRGRLGVGMWVIASLVIALALSACDSNSDSSSSSSSKASSGSPATGTGSRDRVRDRNTQTIGGVTLPTSTGKPNVREVEQIAQAAYIYGYPVVLATLTGEVNTQVRNASQQTSPPIAPTNQLAKYENQATPALTSVPAPPTNVLLTQVWMDLSKEPQVLHVPAIKDRYYLVQILDYWTNSQSISSRTNGSDAGDYAFVGPDWKGKLPAGVKRVSVPTNQNWTFTSVQFNGPSDLDAVRKIQAGFTIQPLSSYGKDYTPPKNVPVTSNVSTKTTPAKQVKAFSAETYLNKLGPDMGPNPPPARDDPVIKQLARIGVVPGKSFDWSSLGDAEQEAAKRGVKKAHQAITKESLNLLGKKVINSWSLQNNLGTYGTKYLFRAAVDSQGLGAELPQDQMYALTFKDGSGHVLSGKRNDYTMHFDKGQFPPTNAIWSLSLYNSKLGLVKNPIDRYVIAPNWNDIKYNSDGSLDIYIQHKAPTSSKKKANWLPAPDGPFVLLLQDYWPKQQMISLNYTIPPVEKN